MRNKIPSFSVKQIDKLKPDDSGKILNFTERGGLTLRVLPSGRKTWTFVYTHNGKQRWLKLGSYPIVSLDEARKRQRDALRLLDKGIDPAAKRQEHRKAWTVDKLCDEFLEKYCAVHKAARSAKEDRLNLARDVRPAWGDRKARDIRRGDVVALLDEIVARDAPTQANRSLATIRKMFNWALEREVVEFNPASGIGKPAPDTIRDRVLSWEEIRQLWDSLDSSADVPASIKKALKLVLLTGCRPGEILGFRYERIKDVWLEIPGTETKNKRPHSVYLSGMALTLIGDTADRSGLILMKDDKPIANYTLAYWLKRACHFGLAPFTPHDLRRTCATRLAELGTDPHIISRILNHVETGITARVYTWHRYAAEITAALEALAARIAQNQEAKATE